MIFFKPTCLLRQKREKDLLSSLFKFYSSSDFCSVCRKMFFSIPWHWTKGRNHICSSRQGQTAQQKIIPVAQNSATTSVLLQAASITTISVAMKCGILKSGFGLDQNMNAVHLSIFPSLGGENIHIRFWDHISSHNLKRIQRIPKMPTCNI